MTELSKSLGKRVTIRLREGSGYRDLVGILTSETSLINRQGELIEFSPLEIAIWREIQPVPDKAGTGAPQSLRINELESIANLTWPALQNVALGGWLLRATGKYTMRANSVLPCGAPPYANPGVPIDKAVAQVVNFYQEQGLTPYFSLPLPLYSELDRYLENNGWLVKVKAQVLVADITKREIAIHEGADFFSAQSPDENWLSLQGDDGISEIMQRYPAHYGALYSHQKIVGGCRIAITNRWAVVSRLFIHEDFRKRGLARHLMENILNVALANGATKALLQVSASNESAIALYKSMGFRFHHNFQYREYMGSGKK